MIDASVLFEFEVRSVRNPDNVVNFKFGTLEHDPFLSKRIVLYIFDLAHDLIRKSHTLFGIMR
jgi:hypothetical protein